MLAINTIQFNSYQAVVDPALEKINQFGIEYLYHITHIDNLSSIVSSALLSHNLAYQQRCVTDISNESVNGRRRWIYPVDGLSLHDYVPMYFNPHNAMGCVLSEQADNLVILKLTPQLLLRSDRVFSDGNAASKDTSFFYSLDDLDKLNWACLNDRTWSNYIDGKRQRCAEVLIPHRILSENIVQVAVKGDSAYDKVQNLVPNQHVVKQPELFF